MKKNIMMRIASCLLVAVLITSFLTGRRIAKYHSVVYGTVTAQIARYRVVANLKNVNSDGTIGNAMRDTLNIHSNGSTGNNAVRATFFNDIFLLDNNDEVDITKKADVFVPEDVLRNGDSYIVPGTGGVTILEIANEGDVTVDISLDFTYYFNGTISPVEAKYHEVDSNGNEIPLIASDGTTFPNTNIWYEQRRNGANNFLDMADVTIRLKYGETRYFKLYWRWPYYISDTQNIYDASLGNSVANGAGDLATYKVIFDVAQVD